MTMNSVEYFGLYTDYFKDANDFLNAVEAKNNLLECNSESTLEKCEDETQTAAGDIYINVCIKEETNKVEYERNGSENSKNKSIYFMDDKQNARFFTCYGNTYNICSYYIPFNENINMYERNNSNLNHSFSLFKNKSSVKKRSQITTKKKNVDTNTNTNTNINRNEKRRMYKENKGNIFHWIFCKYFIYNDKKQEKYKVKTSVTSGNKWIKKIKERSLNGKEKFCLLHKTKNAKIKTVHNNKNNNNTNQEKGKNKVRDRLKNKDKATKDGDRDRDRDRDRGRNFDRNIDKDKIGDNSDERINMNGAGKLGVGKLGTGKLGAGEDNDFKLKNVKIVKNEKNDKLSNKTKKDKGKEKGKEKEKEKEKEKGIGKRSQTANEMKKRRKEEKKGTSYAHLLKTSKIEYDAFYLYNPRFKQGKYHTVMQLQSYNVSIIPFVKPKKLKEEVNQLFSEINPWIPKSLTLSKLRNLKIDLFNIITHVPELDISTVSCAWVFFERLIFKGHVYKSNRKLYAATCLILSLKFYQHDDIHILGKLLLHIKKMDKKENLTSALIFSVEFHVYSLLDFSLQHTYENIRPHIYQYLESKELKFEDIYGTPEDIYLNYKKS